MPAYAYSRADLRRWDRTGRDPHAPSYVVTLVIDDEVVSTHYSYQPMSKTLRLAWQLLAGIPQAECCIRRDGKMVGYLHTNFRGELDEAEIWVHQGGTIKTTALNPWGPVFAGVYAE